MGTSTTIKVIDGVGDTIKVLPMTDHYAITANGEIVAVVCRLNDTQWGVETLVGRVDEPSRFIALHYALKTAMTWRRV